KAANVGRGVSVGLLAAGAHPVSTAIVRLEADGQVVVLVGTTGGGQGPRAAFAQIAAEGLGVEVEQVTVWGADARLPRYDRSAGARTRAPRCRASAMRCSKRWCSRMDSC